MTRFSTSDLAERIDRGVPMRPCPPFCVDHLDESNYPGGFDPGHASHAGRVRVVAGKETLPNSGPHPAPVRLWVQKWDTPAKPNFLQTPHACLTTAVETTELSAADLRALAAAALDVADELDPPTGTALDDPRAALALARTKLAEAQQLWPQVEEAAADLARLAEQIRPHDEGTVS